MPFIIKAYANTDFKNIFSIFVETTIFMREEISYIVNWNGLPCMLNCAIGKSAIFTNIDGTFTICQVDTLRLNDDSLVDELEAIGGFKCLSRKTDINPKEFTLVLSLTEKCNAQCRYCFLDAQTSGNDMSYELIEKSIDLAIEYSNGRAINFAAFGGEPSLRPDLVRHMVNYANHKYSELGIDKSRLKFSITTNGYFNDGFCDFLIQHKFNISLSMDGIRFVQETQRPCKVNYSQLERNLKKLTASDCTLKVRPTVTDFSVCYMLESTKYLHGLGVKRIHFEPVTPGGRACNNDAITKQPDALTFSRNLIECIQYGETNGIDIICFPYMNIHNAPTPFCDGSIRNRLVVGASGLVSTCVEVQNKLHPLYQYLGIGAYNKENKQFDIIFNNRRNCQKCDIKERHEDCKHCAYNFFCAGGCPTRNYRATQDSETISDFRCRIMKLVMPYVLTRFYKKTYVTD